MKVRVIYMLDFTVIKYKDKGIYLGLDQDRCSASKTFYKWVRNIDDAVWFQCPAEADAFARSYFKNFTLWEFSVASPNV